MRIVIAGGSGFLGQALTTRLIADGHDIVLLTRGAESAGSEPNVRVVQWTPNGDADSWAGELDAADAVVNLAGATIGQRWTAARKRAILDSRVLSTRSLAAAVRRAKTPPRVFLQMSGAGFYGAHDDGPEFDEGSPPGDDFLARVCVAWEAEAQPVATFGSRLVILRNGIVLSRSGGALPRMLTPFKFLVGGPIASGRQWMAFINLEDWIGMAIWAIDTSAVSGPINAVAPEAGTNAQFASAIGRALNRPALIPVPGFALKLLFGEFATLGLIRGQHVIPRRALELGYQFKFPTLDRAIQAALR